MRCGLRRRLGSSAGAAHSSSRNGISVPPSARCRPAGVDDRTGCGCCTGEGRRAGPRRSRPRAREASILVESRLDELDPVRDAVGRPPARGASSMTSSGSTAKTRRAPRRAASRANIPLPAPRSSTTESGRTTCSSARAYASVRTRSRIIRPWSCRLYSDIVTPGFTVLSVCLRRVKSAGVGVGR